jgi:arabinosaccharide transport system permease protein
MTEVAVRLQGSTLRRGMSAVLHPLFDPRLAPFVLLAPFVAIFLVFRVWPTIQAVQMSFQNVQELSATDYVGLKNYQEVITSDRFIQAVSNTTVYTIGTLLILIPIPLVLAALLDRGRTWKPTFWRMAIFIPALVSLVVVSIVFRVILAGDGLLNAGLQAIGLPPQKWLDSASLAIPSLLIIATWRWMGVNMLYYNSGLVNIPRELYEACAIDGATGWQTFRQITVPLLRPTIFFVLLISVIGGFQLFVEPFLLWPGGNSRSDSGLSVALLIYRTAFTSFKFGEAAAMGVLLAAIIMVLSLIQFRFFGARGLGR